MLTLSQLVISTDQSSAAVPCCALGFGHVVVAAASHGCCWGTASRNRRQHPNPEVLKPQVLNSQLSQLSQLCQLCQLCPGSPHWKVSLSILVGSTRPARKHSSGFKFARKKGRAIPQDAKKDASPYREVPSLQSAAQAAQAAS